MLSSEHASPFIGMSADRWTRDQEREALAKVEAAADALRDAARAYAHAVHEAKPEFLDLFCIATRKRDQTPPEVIEGFVELIADCGRELLDAEELDRSKNIAERGRE